MSTTSAMPQTTVSTWKLDPVHSVAEFKVKHMMISNVKGQFTGISGSMILDEADVTKSRVDMIIEAASINTREAQRDAHLKSADFFDAANHPTIRFQSKAVKADGPGSLTVTGDLTIRGVTREVVLKIDGPSGENKDPWGNLRRGAEATTRIKRKDFGLTWNQALETGGVLVGDDVDITLDVQLIKSV